MPRIIPREESAKRDSFFKQGTEVAAKLAEIHLQFALADEIRKLKRVRNLHRKRPNG